PEGYRHRYPGRRRVRQVDGAARQLRSVAQLFLQPFGRARSRRTQPIRCDAAGEVVLTNFADRRDRARFAAAYADPDSGTSIGHRPMAPTCVGPLTYIGHDAIKADIANFKAALAAAGVEEGFMTSVGPASCSRIGNAYYKTEEELVFACAEAMREEYKAILDAGLVLQFDDPAIAETW